MLQNVQIAMFQGVEYSVSSFTISDGIFGTCFYFGTGLIGAPISNNTNKISNKIEENTKLSPYWITGFSDAESAFLIKIGEDTTRKFNLRIISEFVIELHQRDFEVLKEIKNFFNVGSLKLRVRKGKTTGIYSVQSIKDLTEVIIPHFQKYPLITQKQADFNLFSSVVELIKNKRHLDEEGLKEIISLRASMNKGLSGILKIMFPEIKPVERLVISSQEIKSPFWLLGFVDGEGCFYIKIRNNKQVALVFSITQHSRDLGLMNVIKNYLDCGIIEQVSTRPTIVNFVVYKFNDNYTKILPFFEKYSLVTQKNKDFIKFSEIASIIEKKQHLTIEGINKIISIKDK
jgi:hypothetical protein